MVSTTGFEPVSLGSNPKSSSKNLIYVYNSNNLYNLYYRLYLLIILYYKLYLQKNKKQIN